MKRSLIFIFVSFSFFSRGQVNSFSFNINGATPPGFVQALTIAGQKWSNYLNISVPIKVNVFTINTNLVYFSGICLANGRKNFTNAPFNNILYTTALANQLANVETNPGEYDMDIYFNLFTDFYFGTGNPPPNQQDFITTAMHEIGHGLGFYSDGYVDASGVGSFGNIPPSALFPLTCSFPWRGQDSVPSIFDKYIVRFSGKHLTAITPKNSPALGDSIKNGAVYFNGPVYANPSHFNTPVRLSGGAGTFSLGVDLLHIHDSYDKTIMSYYWGMGDTVRTPGPWEIGILREIGWKPSAVGLNEHSAYSMATAYPNPANLNLTISGPNIYQINLCNSQGEMVLTQLNPLREAEIELDTGNLKEGIYFLRITFSDNVQTLVKKIVVN